MSTVGECAVGQRAHCRCQQPGVFARQVTRVEVHHGVADDYWAAVGGAEQLSEVGVLSTRSFGGD
jgi:hypothetical protein